MTVLATYRELVPPPALADVASCLWWRSVGAAPATARVLPDGCVDIVYRRGGGLVVAGPDTRAVDVATGGAETFAGVRFRTGWAAAALAVPVDELRDRRVDLRDLWGERADALAARLDEAPHAAAAAHLLGVAIAERRADMRRPDELVLAAVSRLGRPGTRVGSVAAELGVSERHLLRRFRPAVGYGPKTWHRVARVVQLRRACAAHTGIDLGRLAHDLGYADQAHMTRECTALTGRTPARLAAGR